MSVREPGDDPVETLRATDRKMLQAYLKLAPEQRKLVRDLVDGLSDGGGPTV